MWITFDCTRGGQFWHHAPCGFWDSTLCVSACHGCLYYIHRYMEIRTKTAMKFSILVMPPYLTIARDPLCKTFLLWNVWKSFTAKGVQYEDVMKWKHFPRSWPFVQGIHRSLVNSPHKGKCRGALMVIFYLGLNKRLSKYWWGWWFETPSRPLWRHCTEISKLTL